MAPSNIAPEYLHYEARLTIEAVIEYIPEGEGPPLGRLQASFMALPEVKRWLSAYQIAVLKPFVLMVFCIGRDRASAVNISASTSSISSANCQVALYSTLPSLLTI